MLEDPDWKFDEIPEVMDGMNVQDFYDKDIEGRLAELEREEEILLLGKAAEEFDEEDDPDLLEARAQIVNKRALKKLEHKLKSKKTAFVRNIPLGQVEESLEKNGKPTERVHDRFKKSTKPKPLSGLYAESDNEDEEGLWEEADEDSKRREQSERRMDRKLRSMSRSRSVGTKKELTENEKVNKK
jgi:nucleolar GTP-binding protein